MANLANTYPTPSEVERYRADAHAHGMARARQLLLADSPARAFVAVVMATEVEARIVGFGGIQIPVADGMRRLVVHRRERIARREQTA